MHHIFSNANVALSLIKIHLDSRKFQIFCSISRSESCLIIYLHKRVEESITNTVPETVTVEKDQRYTVSMNCSPEEQSYSKSVSYLKELFKPYHIFSKMF